MKIAFVYDRINKFGGAERILLALHQIWPEAPLYTAVYNPKTAQWAEDFQIIPSFLQKFPLARSTHEIYPWLTPLSFESFNFEEYDIVISITSAEAKGILTKPKTMHLCYCLTPTRYLWSHEEEYLANPGFSIFNPLIKIIARPIFNRLKEDDKIACNRPDYYLSISKNVSQRIKKYYNQDSIVIYPPVDIEKFNIRKLENRNWKLENYFLVVSRLVSYKKVDLAIKAFNDLGWSLKIVGVGREMGNLKRIAKKNIEFLGELTDQELLSYYQNCQALIFPQEEDFGMTALECQAAGKPVIAFKRGGALETIVEGLTGEFFTEQTKECLIKKVIKFDPKKYHSENCRQNAGKFAKEIFKKTFITKIETLWKKYRNIFA